LPRPSANAGAPIERGLGGQRVAKKWNLKGNYLLPEHGSLHRNARRVARASLTGRTGNRLVTTVRMRDRIGWPPGLQRQPKLN
jgi:hypothetical protein